MKIKPYSFLEHVEVVDDDADEEVEREEGAAHDEDDEIEIRPQIGFVRRLQIDSAHVHRIRHDFHPTLKRRLYLFTTNKTARLNSTQRKQKQKEKLKENQTDHLEKSQIGVADVVKVNGRICPRQIAAQTVHLGIDQLWRIAFPCFVIDALVELAAKQLHAQDGKDEPKDETDEQHVEDGRNGEHERVDDNLWPLKTIEIYKTSIV